MNQPVRQQPETIIPQTDSLCTNCGHVIEEKFCPNCGQKRYRRIDGKYIAEEVQNGVIQINGGFFYTLLRTLQNPGRTAREFIEGKRVSHYKPLAMVFVLGGISTFLAYKVLKLDELMVQAYSAADINSDFMMDYVAQAPNFANLMVLALIPFFALTTKTAFRKWGNNYYEHIVMCSYIMIFYTLAGMLLIYPVFFVFKNHPHFYLKTVYLTYLGIPFLLVWFFKQYYKEKPLKSVIGRVLGSLGLVIAGYLLFFILAVIIMLAVMFIKGPEMAEYFAPK